MMGAMLVRHDPASAAAVRRQLALDLDLRGIDPESIAEITLVASELVGNAVRHVPTGRDGQLGVSWTVGTADVEVSVKDPSPDVPVTRAARADAPDGRGLAIVSALTSAWGYERTADGKRVWARVPVLRTG